MAPRDDGTGIPHNALMLGVAFIFWSLGAAILWTAWSYLPRLVEAWWYYALLTLGGVAGAAGICFAVIRVSAAGTKLRLNLQSANLELTRKIEALSAESRQRFDRIERQMEAFQKKTPPFLGALTVAAGLWQSILKKLIPEPKAALKEIAILAVLGLVYYWATTALGAEGRGDRVIGAIILLAWLVACIGLVLLLRSPTEIKSFFNSLAPVDYALVGLTGLVALVVPILACTVWRTTK